MEKKLTEEQKKKVAKFQAELTESYVAQLDAMCHQLSCWGYDPLAFMRGFIRALAESKQQNQEEITTIH